MHDEAVADRNHLDHLAQRYDERDEAYLRAVREGRLAELRTLAQEAAEAARAWEAEAYRRYFAARKAEGPDHEDVIGLHIGAEKAEVLAELWTDLAAAHVARESC